MHDCMHTISIVHEHYTHAEVDLIIHMHTCSDIAACIQHFVPNQWHIRLCKIGGAKERDVCKAWKNEMCCNFGHSPFSCISQPFLLF